MADGAAPGNEPIDKQEWKQVIQKYEESFHYSGIIEFKPEISISHFQLPHSRRLLTTFEFFIDTFPSLAGKLLAIGA